ncbi:MAG: multidrug transporter [Marinobacter sp.]|uniref:multidrug transporter n=1 Tax=Marinobacter sp. TaxID=50741 RepID=UPI00299E5AEE|nr:multidrug transporter [Marinobacter sp.]MDX1754983.1 multidrug transporter [Marinobacter sp.]
MSYPAAIIVLAVFGGLLVLAGLAFFVRPRWVLGWLKGMLVLALLGAGGYSLVLAAGMSQYQTLSGMQVVATVEVHRLAPQSWNVTIQHNDSLPETHTLAGDQWQVDARIVLFGGPMRWLGVAPGYRLERLSGRYLSLEQERSADRTVIGLAGGRWPDIWAWDQSVDLPFVEGVYGNATFMPMRDRARFDIRLSSSGLVAMAANEQAREAIRRWGGG